MSFTKPLLAVNPRLPSSLCSFEGEGRAPHRCSLLNPCPPLYPLPFSCRSFEGEEGEEDEDEDEDDDDGPAPKPKGKKGSAEQPPECKQQ